MEKIGIAVQCGAFPEDTTFEQVARQVEVTTAVLAYAEDGLLKKRRIECGKIHFKKA